MAGSAFRLVLALSALAVIAFATGASVTAPKSGQGAAALKAGVAWRGCGKDLQCAHVHVPLDWDRPGGRKIKLAVIRHLASKPPADGKAPTLFMNPGGPGDTGLGL